EVCRWEQTSHVLSWAVARPAGRAVRQAQPGWVSGRSPEAADRPLGARPGHMRRAEVEQERFASARHDAGCGALAPAGRPAAGGAAGPERSEARRPVTHPGRLVCSVPQAGAQVRLATDVLRFGEQKVAAASRRRRLGWVVVGWVVAGPGGRLATVPRSG